MDRNQLEELLAFAVRLSEKAGVITLKYFPRPGSMNLTVDHKADDSPVTVADRETEEFMRTEITKQFPDHGLFGEEFGEEKPDAETRWIIDPIDGTKSFIRGVPLYGVLIGLEHRGECVLGVVHHPALGETLKGAKGLGAFWNETPARVSQVSDPKRAMFLTTDAAVLHQINRGFSDALCREVKLLRTWGDCYGHTLVATGRAEAMFDALMSPWDCAALKPIIEEAGGTWTDFKGNSTIYGEDAFSTNRDLLPFIQNLLDEK